MTIATPITAARSASCALISRPYRKAGFAPDFPAMTSEMVRLLAELPAGTGCGALPGLVPAELGTFFNPDILICEAERRARLEAAYALLVEADSFVFLDTEATGGRFGRLIEVALVETDTEQSIIGGLHFRCNPHRRSSPTARRVHGILDCELEHCPEFGAKAAVLLDAVRGKVVVIHDRTMDLLWLNRELRLACPDAPRFEDVCTVVDSLVLAKAIPSERRRNGLDALLDWYGFSRSNTQHDAYGDANLLSKVFFELWWDLDEFLFGN